MTSINTFIKEAEMVKINNGVRNICLHSPTLFNIQIHTDEIIIKWQIKT
jgi:hypothetical protein